MKNDDNNIIITDNFLAKDQFVALRDPIIADDFPWFYSIGINYPGEPQSISPGMFVHGIYEHKQGPISPFYEHYEHILEELKVGITRRIKLNLNPRLKEPFYSDFHIDIFDMAEFVIALMTTSIFYINTNNGYTEFEDGTKVESVANRIVTFPTNIKHRGVTQTDEQTRIVINFSYLKGR